MIKGKLLKEDCKKLRDISVSDFPKKEEGEELVMLNFFRHIDDIWFEEILKESKIEGIDPVKARRVVTVSIRKMMEAKKR